MCYCTVKINQESLPVGLFVCTSRMNEDTNSTEQKWRSPLLLWHSLKVPWTMENPSLNINMIWINLSHEFNLVWYLGLWLSHRYGWPSPPKIRGCQIDQQKQSWFKDQLQDSMANKGMARPNYRQFSFPSWNRTP